MSAHFEINGKKLLSIRSVAAQTSYSRDYITRLAREGKIVASQIERQWFIDLDSLKHYQSAVEIEQRARQQKLSEERKRERERLQAAMGTLPQQKKKQASVLSPRSRRAATAVAALAVLVGGVWQFSPALLQGLQYASPVLLEGMNAMSDQLNQEYVGIPRESGAPVFGDGTQSVRALAGIEQGMLLLPHGSTATSVDPTQFFSDEVSVFMDEEGQTFVVRRDAQGKVVEKIPYVLVPINQAQ